MRTTISRQVVKRCPFKDEWDVGTLTLVFDGEAPELHALAAKIDRLCEAPELTHESFTKQVSDLFAYTEVTTTWTTGAWAVEVTA